MPAGARIPGERNVIDVCEKRVEGKITSENASSVAVGAVLPPSVMNKTTHQLRKFHSYKLSEYFYLFLRQSRLLSSYLIKLGTFPLSGFLAADR